MEEELIAFCKERMADYKYPRKIELLDELPTTATGKVLRRELRNEARPEAQPKERETCWSSWTLKVDPRGCH